MRRDVRILLVGDGESRLVNALYGSLIHLKPRRGRREEHYSHLPHQGVFRSPRKTVSCTRSTIAHQDARGTGPARRSRSYHPTRSHAGECDHIHRGLWQYVRQPRSGLHPGQV